MKSPISLKGFLSFQFSVAAVLPAIAITVLVWFFLVPATQTQRDVREQVIARSTAGRISAYLEGGKRQLTALAGYFQADGYDPGQSQIRLLDAQCGKGEIFEALFIADDKNMAIQSVGLAQGLRLKRYDLIGLDISDRRFIYAAKDLQGAVWSEIFPSTVSGHRAVALTVPITNGFITGEIILENLSGLIGNLPGKSEWLALIIDGRGVVLADSQKRHLGRVLNLNHRPAEETGTPFSPGSFALDGERMSGSLAVMDGPDWTVLVAQPMRIAYKPIRDTFLLIALVLTIAFALAMAISWFQAGKLSNLFLTYSERARSISDGRYDVQWPQAKTHELKQLGQSLQRMAENISQREKALMDSERLLKELVANVPGVMYQFNSTRDQFYTSEFLSKKATEIFGLEPDSKTFIDEFYNHIPDDEKERYLNSVRQAVDRIEPWNYEGRFTKPDGKTIWFSGTAVPREEKEYIVFYGVLMDITLRKEIEESLWVTQFSVDHANIGIYRIASDAKILEANQKAVQFLGYSKEELENMYINDIDPSVTRDIWGSLWQALVEEKSLIQEREHRRKDGRMIPVEVYANILEYEGRQYAIAFIKDISERERMELALKEGQERLDLALSGANEGIWDWRIHKDTLYLDSRYYTMAGYHPNEFPAKYDEILKRIHKDDLESVKWINDQYLTGNRDTFEVEFRFRRKDGSYMWIQAKGRIVARDAEGNPMRFSGTHTDISDRKQAEEALRKNERLLNNILESMNEGLMVLDNDFNCTIFNRSLGKMVYKTKEEAIGISPWESFPDLKGTLVEKNIKKTMTGESAENLEIQLPLPNGQTAWFRDSFSPLKDDAGNVIGVVGVISDITQQKHAEIEREKLLKELQEALENVKKLRGLLPICSSCKKIRDDKGYWNQIEFYIRAHSEAEFSHCICPDCAKKLYPSMDIQYE